MFCLLCYFSEKGQRPTTDETEKVSRQGFRSDRHRSLDDLVERRGPQLVSLKLTKPNLIRQPILVAALLP